MLPGVATLGKEGSWSYSYDNTVDFSGMPMSIPTEGTYVELGFESVKVPAGTFADAYKLSNTYTQDRTALDSFGFGGGGVITAYAEYYYVEGIGLVYEKTVDTSDGHTIMEKSLTSYSGL